MFMDTSALVILMSFITTPAFSDHYFKVKLFQIEELRIRGFLIFHGDNLVTCVRKCSLFGGCMIVAYNRSARVCEFYTSMEKMTLKAGSDLLVGAVNTRVKTGLSRCRRKCNTFTFIIFAESASWKQVEKRCSPGKIASAESQATAEVLARASGKEIITIGVFLKFTTWRTYDYLWSKVQYTHWASHMPAHSWIGNAALSRKLDYKWISTNSVGDAYLCGLERDIYDDCVEWVHTIGHTLNLNLTFVLHDNMTCKGYI